MPMMPIYASVAINSLNETDCSAYRRDFSPFISVIPTMTMWLLLVGVVVTVLVSIPVLLAFYTLILAAITHWRQRNNSDSFRTAFYVGRVSHTRLVPIVHSFNYPFFMCAVDLDEADGIWAPRKGALWPLSTVMMLRRQDHYKNGEGGSSDLTLTERTFNLLKERTNGKFQPSTATHRVVLVTHLCYYGYCFNPVSFFYILERTSNKMDAIILEVSNTPWNEMQCYVLHPDSVDAENAKPGKPKQRPDGSEIASTNYTFLKTFHVSPFMDMEHLYDWTFWEFPLPNDDISLFASMVKGDVRQFTANVDIAPIPFTPFQMAWHLMKFPVYCAIVQVWIHIQAFWLFQKGAEYQPHPKGSETTASRMIASIMAPLFALKERIESFQSRDKQE